MTNHREIVHIREVIDERDKRYCERFLAQEKAVAQSLLAAERAVQKAEAASDKRFDSVNEFRAALQDAATQNVQRNEFFASKEAADLRIQGLTQRLDKLEGKSAGMNASWVVMLGAIGALGVLATILARLIP